MVKILYSFCRNLVLCAWWPLRLIPTSCNGYSKKREVLCRVVTHLQTLQRLYKHYKDYNYSVIGYTSCFSFFAVARSSKFSVILLPQTTEIVQSWLWWVSRTILVVTIIFVATVTKIYPIYSMRILTSCKNWAKLCEISHQLVASYGCQKLTTKN